MAEKIRTIPEPNKTLDVVVECDVVVVGGGPGGIGAAVTAARNGADTILIERYGYLGGMGTGGLVTIIPCLSDFSGTMQIRATPPFQCFPWLRNSLGEYA